MSAADHVRQALDIYLHRVESLNRAIRAREAVPAELVRDTALALALVLRAYGLPSNWRVGYGTTPITPLPPEIASDIARNIQIVCGGHIPQWMLHLQKRGNMPVDPRIRTWQGYAVAYVKLCKAGLINDKAPIAAIAAMFGVSPRAVQYWMKNIDAEPSDFFPSEMSDAQRASLFPDRVREAGEQYQSWGPGPKNAHPFGKGRKRPRAKR